MRSSFFLSTAALLASSFVLQTEAQQACNGYAALCSKQYSQVTFATTHNAYAFSADALAANQANSIPTQLKDGIRAFMLDAYNVPSGAPNDIQLCHTSCELFDGGLLSKTLGQIKTFMDANPNEVITILWENSQKLSPAQFQTVYTAAGLAAMSYAQPAGSTAWPTLAEMISSGKRIVSFLDSGADASVPWLMAEYDYVFETPYSIPINTPYPCTIDRPKGEKRQMYVLNHFVSGQFQSGGQTVDIPQSGAAEKTNGADLITHVNACQAEFGQAPNFIAVDFYQKGAILQTTAQLNGVTWNGKAATQGGKSAAMASTSVQTMAISALAVAAGLGLLII